MRAPCKIRGLQGQQARGIESFAHSTDSFLACQGTCDCPLLPRPCDTMLAELKLGLVHLLDEFLQLNFLRLFTSLMKVVVIQRPCLGDFVHFAFLKVTSVICF